VVASLQLKEQVHFQVGRHRPDLLRDARGMFAIRFDDVSYRLVLENVTYMRDRVCLSAGADEHLGLKTQQGT
jgi:hypothetical protein